MPYATHEGTLTIGGFKLRVIQLSNGQRVFDAEDIARFLGLLGDGSHHPDAVLPVWSEFVPVDPPPPLAERRRAEEESNG